MPDNNAISYLTPTVLEKAGMFLLNESVPIIRNSYVSDGTCWLSCHAIAAAWMVVNGRNYDSEIVQAIHEEWRALWKANKKRNLWLKDPLDLHNASRRSEVLKAVRINMITTVLSGDNDAITSLRNRLHRDGWIVPEVV